ncbi:MAG: hypothetical protein MO846_00585 [Candidatus Devosia symbiotica]|nr:hypothetical protein [Candidatus Devosia symbiotica]
MGVLAYATPFALFPPAQTNLASGVAAAIINTLTPIITVIVSHFWRGSKKANRIKSAGVMIGFAGAAILASLALSSDSDSQLWAI